MKSINTMLTLSFLAILLNYIRAENNFNLIEPLQHGGKFFYQSMQAGFNASSSGTDYDDHAFHFVDMIVSNNT